MQPDADEELLALWYQLVADPLTVNEFVESALPAVLARLAPMLPGVHADEVTTAAEDALLAFLKRPTAFDPNRGRLVPFLVRAAKCDYLNNRRGEGRHHRGRIPWDCVELDPTERNEIADDAPSFDAPELQGAIASLSETDRRVLDCMRAGERQTATFAAVLGLDDRPVSEQEEAVKRAKDRIKIRLKRAVGGSSND